MPMPCLKHKHEQTNIWWWWCVVGAQAAGGRTTVSSAPRHARASPHTSRRASRHAGAAGQYCYGNMRAFKYVGKSQSCMVLQVAPVAKQPGEWTVTVRFGATGTLPLYLNGTRNCTVPQVDPETTGPALPVCCESSATSDFDVSADNQTWATGARAHTLHRYARFSHAW